MTKATGDAEDECPHGLTPDSCSVCKHGLSKAARPQGGRRFRAEWPGICYVCKLPFPAGAFIRALTYDWAHEKCASAPKPSSRRP